VTRRRIRIEEQGNVVIVRGWGASDLLKQAGIKPFWVGTQGGFMVDLDRLPDLLAHLQQRRIAVEIAGGTPPDGEAA